MDRDCTTRVVAGCLQALQANHQVGDLQIVTGKGRHSHNHRSSLRPLALEIVKELGLEYTCPDDNPGVIVVHLQR
jgi:hypothetical protein